MALNYEERSEIEVHHKKAAGEYRRTGVYTPLTARIKALQRKATQLDEPDEPTRPAPTTAAAPMHTTVTTPENPVRRQEDIERRIAEIKAARRKEVDENQAEVDRILDQRDIPGVRSARARQRTGEHHVLEASDLDDFGRVVPGRRSFRTGQTRQ